MKIVAAARWLGMLMVGVGLLAAVTASTEEDPPHVPKELDSTHRVLQLGGLGRITELKSTEFKTMMEAGNAFDAIVDVRRQDEWDVGHIANATFMENLASLGTASQVSTPDDLAGCEYCNIVVYCRSGARAQAALEHLVQAGFKGYLYNGLGVSQWTAEGYPLVNTSSVDPPCKTDAAASDQCRLNYLARTSSSLGTTMEADEDETSLATGSFWSLSMLHVLVATALLSFGF